MPIVPLFLFLLWELPSMIMMSLHKLWCAITGGSLQRSFRGIWFYRIVGMFVFWTAVLVVIGLAGTRSGSGVAAGAASVAVVAVPVLLLWAKFSSRGA